MSVHDFNDHVNRTPRTERAGRKPPVADVQDIRRHFPALARRHNGLPVAYFDGPGGTQVPSEALRQ